MFSKNFHKWDTLLGWAVFAISFITYFLTVEPTNSFWDAGEYIATAAKLQVGHPPGAPLLQMIGAFFAMFALEANQVAMMVNLVSGVSSAFTILFMFWTITNLTRKLIDEGEPMTNSKAIAILGSGLVGAWPLPIPIVFGSMQRRPKYTLWPVSLWHCSYGLASNGPITWTTHAGIAGLF